MRGHYGKPLEGTNKRKWMDGTETVLNINRVDSWCRGARGQRGPAERIAPWRPSSWRMTPSLKLEVDSWPRCRFGVMRDVPYLVLHLRNGNQRSSGPTGEYDAHDTTAVHITSDGGPPTVSCHLSSLRLLFFCALRSRRVQC